MPRCDHTTKQEEPCVSRASVDPGEYPTPTTAVATTKAGHEKRRAATRGHRLANGSSRQRSLGQESPPFDTSTSGHPGRTRGKSHTRYLNRRAWFDEPE